MRGRGRSPTEQWADFNGILWRLRCGASWRDVPERYGKWNTIFRRFRRWTEAGTWEIVSVTLAEMMADTSADFTGVLREAEVRIGMDGRGHWMDKVFIERLWRLLKYECVYLNAFETGSELRTGLGRWFDYYNGQRLHSSLAVQTPDEVYGQIAATPYPGHAPDMAPSAMAT